MLHAIEASALEYCEILILNTIECIIKMCIVVLNSWEFDARFVLYMYQHQMSEGDFHSNHDYFCLFILNYIKELWRCSLDGATHKMVVEPLTELLWRTLEKADR